ncbi:MAG: O-antigen ligase family protein, partial [Waddliaceae bacterium]
MVLGAFRSIWIGVAVSIGYILYKNQTKVFTNVLVISMFALVVLSGVTARGVNVETFDGASLLDTSYHRITAGTFSADSSLRFLISARFFQQSLESPLIGHGFGSDFLQGSERFPVSSSPNFFLNIAYEMGFPALFMFLYIFFKLFVIVNQGYNRVRHSEFNPFFLGYSACLLSIGILLNMFPINAVFGRWVGIGFFHSKMGEIRRGE